MKASITVSSVIIETPRVLQVRGMFDLPPAEHSVESWEVDLPLEERSWHIGLIVGPSGCGKSTIARRLWPEETARSSQLDWPRDRSLLDGFPADLPIKEVVALLSSVGLSSPPAWLRPFHVLSTGQQFRVILARLLAEAGQQPGCVCVLDEFTSVVDRTVARIGSAALAKTVRQRGQRFVAVTCHEDVLDWLQPDWVYRPAERLFAWRCLRCRPPIILEIVRCPASAWPLFAPHHYLSHHLNRSAVCFLASWEERPIAFSAWLPFVGAGPPTRREHRTVVLPDYQGVGIGNALSATIASMWQALGYRATSTTTHPAMIQSRLRSPLWRMTRGPALAGRERKLVKLKHATTRLTAGFRYVGPSMPKEQALDLLGC
ncbi:MAG TPA: GNAT family N-acetyltransferase [Gemmataceae bacterium]|nr:GNAT family N-acetyltransferase [Gemmataceae bacterium]